MLHVSSTKPRTSLRPCRSLVCWPWAPSHASRIQLRSHQQSTVALVTNLQGLVCAERKVLNLVIEKVSV